MFSSGLILGGHECLCATSQKRHLYARNFVKVNFCLFANGDVSIRFNGQYDDVVLEWYLNKKMFMFLKGSCDITLTDPSTYYFWSGYLDIWQNMYYTCTVEVSERLPWAAEVIVNVAGREPSYSSNLLGKMHFTISIK